MRLLFVLLLLALPTPVHAQDPALKLEHVWSRAAMAGREGAVYLTITNSGPTDTLTGASTPVAASAGVHETINDKGIMKMRPVPKLPVPQGQPVTLKPGSYHIMLMDLKQPLKQGDSFPITLTFATAGAITATATVEKAGAMSDMPGMSMPMLGKQP